MKGPVKEFGDAAQGLARNPLGIIALFIVLVYGFASLVAFAGSFSPTERAPLIYFLVFFPVLVLGVFSWLVAKHSGRLFSPRDFRDERIWEGAQRDRYSAVASLTVAAGKDQAVVSEAQIQQIVAMVQHAAPAVRTVEAGWRNHILWVDDNPDNNKYERKAFEDVGLKITLALSTNEALNLLSRERFAAIMSDMGRREGPREGYVLLDALRARDDQTPLFFYASSSRPEHIRETYEHHGQGCTDKPQELFQMITKTVISGA
jgi:CheY-like chemotaxis protein